LIDYSKKRELFMKYGQMTSRERIYTLTSGGIPDRPPILGGWIANPGLLCRVSGKTMDEYKKDPEKISSDAYRILGTDGVIGIFVPKNAEEYRCVDIDTYRHAQGSYTLEETIRYIDGMPSAEDYERDYDFKGEYDRFKSEILRFQALCGDMQYIPPMWNSGAKVNWYDDFGYENFFMIVGLYPERAVKLMEAGGAIGYCLSKLVAMAAADGIFPPAVLMGEDICTQRGPMISPDFLEKYYAPQLKHGLRPLLDAGIKPVWHCDGDVRLLLDMLTDCGIQGFQGFQPECGVTVELIASRRTKEGKPVLIYGPLSVTTELPVCSPEEIKAKVRHAIEVCRGNADLAFFTSNTINPDVPLENIEAMYEAVMEG
jgi:hypothetical protein